MLAGVSPPSFTLFDTPIGRCALVWTARGVAGVQLPEADDDATRARVVLRHPGAGELPAEGETRRVFQAIAAHFAGRCDPLDGVELDYAAVPLFHRRVYEALRGVRPGETIGYGDLAARAGSPGAARAVGQAVGKNPFAIVVPCHRVLAAKGGAGGFSAYGGVATKRRMLALEGVALAVSAGEPPPPFDAGAAAEHLARIDARLARIIAQVGPPRIHLAATQSTFEALAESIVYQQLNGRAAATIHGRLRALFPRRRVRPQPLLAHADEALRGAGLSRGKMLALRDLAAKTLDGTVPAIGALHALEDDAIVERLVQVRGIGRWTVEMLLIFRLGRPDVLPVDDYGVRKGFQLVYGKREMPTPKELMRLGEKWRPFRTVASWYLWRAVDLKRQKAASGRG
jgi:methylated-DNA-[protein]-cysteine S-methyltransferase